MGPFLPIQSAARIVWNATHGVPNASALPILVDVRFRHGVDLSAIQKNYPSSCNAPENQFGNWRTDLDGGLSNIQGRGVRRRPDSR